MDCMIFKKLLKDLVPYLDELSEDMLTDILMNYDEYQAQGSERVDIFHVILDREKKNAEEHEFLTTRDIALLYHISTSAQAEY